MCTWTGHILPIEKLNNNDKIILKRYWTLYYSIIVVKKLIPI